MACYRAQNRKAHLLIIFPRRKDYRRSPSRLLPASLRGEVYPYQVAGFGHVFAPYHNSFPTGSPQSVSECWFSGVIPATNCSSVGLRFGFRILTLPGPSTSTSRSSPVLSFAATATGLGIRTARLFPHFASCVFMEPRVSTEYILYGTGWKGQGPCQKRARLIGSACRHCLCVGNTPSKMPPLAVGRPGQNYRELFESSLRSIVAGRSWLHAAFGANWSP